MKSTLVVDGKEYSYWQRVKQNASLTNVAGSFSLTLKGEQEGTKAPPFNGDEAMQFFIGEQLVIDGYLDGDGSDISGTSLSYEVSGRDKTADLVDSSALVDGQELQNVDLKQMAEIVCKPHKIEIVCPEPGEPFKKVTVQDGETCLSLIQRHAKQRNMNVYTLGDGKLYIGKIKPIDTGLQLYQPGNVEKLTRQRDFSQRFHEIRVKGQAAGKENWGGKAASQRNAKIIDDEIRKNRVLIAHSETGDSNATPEDRAQRELAERRGKGTTYKATVKGWLAENDELWSPGWGIALTCPRHDLKEVPLIISELERSRSETQAETTVLTLHLPEAYE